MVNGVQSCELDLTVPVIYTENLFDLKWRLLLGKCAIQMAVPVAAFDIPGLSGAQKQASYTKVQLTCNSAPH